MVIVGGTFQVDPELREAFIVGRVASMRTSRAEAGCLEYVLGADPVDAGRVVLFERWASQEHLDAHISALRARAADGADVQPKAVTIRAYDVTGERPLM